MRVMQQVRRVVLVVVRASSGPPRTWPVLLLNRGHSLSLPAGTLMIPGYDSARTAYAQLRQLCEPQPGQRLWLLGYWAPDAVYLALLPASPVCLLHSQANWWTREQVRSIRMPEEQRAWVQRAWTWLEDGGHERHPLVFG
ncbi:hypothetical protein [Thermogemmatispora sp.]|uniref:hypothetical protein n=1 Tax=Thermogemmatispora sp. TaxID=1968838 RepID=UPI0035E440BE